MWTYNTVAKHPLPFASYGNCKMFKISDSEFRTMDIHRRMRACADEFLAMVAEGVVHGVYMVVTRQSISVTRQHKASGGKWTFCHCVTRSHTNVTQQLEDGGVSPTLIMLPVV